MRNAWLILPALLLALACGDDDGTMPPPGTDSGPGGNGDRDGGSSDDDGGGGGMCDTSISEDTMGACTDGCDNDGDGFTDCVAPGDPGCDEFCVMQCSDDLGDENTAERCSDGCSNDGDAFADCDDNDCAGTTACPIEASNRTCSDGVDNDDNSFIDCMDFSCTRVGRDDAPLRVCAVEMTNAACSDGEDNDEDGMADCLDPDCRGDGTVVCDGATETGLTEDVWAAAIETACTDEASSGGEDGNDFVDCADFSCLFFADACADTVPEAGNARCSDGIDNDGDGVVDCDEASCSEALNEGIVVCEGGSAVSPRPDDAMITELANARCGNGVNDDEDDEMRDRFTDCADFSCSQDPLITACAGEDNVGEATDALCSDGMDNDGDDFVDCQDRSCQNTFITVCEVSTAQCSDGLDNDGNGFPDCEDFSCQNSPVCDLIEAEEE